MDKQERKSYFCSNGYQEDSLIDTESGHQLELATLPPFLRTLLVMDGTVTKALESWFWEPVKVIPLVNDQEDLGKLGNEDKQDNQIFHVLKREVLLQGEKSSTNFACARSNVSLNNLPEDISSALVSGKIGIGELLREKGLETYRELFDINYWLGLPQEDSLLQKMMPEGNSSPIVSRSYKIWLNKKPAITVTEFFPVQEYLR